MKHIKHPLCNDVLHAPPGDENYIDLHICREDGNIWSFWQPNAEELAAIVSGGAIALRVASTTHPPLILHAMTPEQRDTREKTNDEVRVIYEANRARCGKLVALMKVAIAELANATGRKHEPLFNEFLDLIALNSDKNEIVRALTEYNPEPTTN
jgi:hypothetical protein